MALYTSIRSGSAMLVGVVFTAITSAILTDDVFRHGAPFTTKHTLALAVLGGAIYFGHRWWIELCAMRLGTMLGCALLFISGSGLCVVLSAGRNAEVTSNKVLLANSVNTARIDAQRDRDEARVRYHAALKAEESECSDGSGAKCQAKRITRMVRREEYDAAEAKLRSQQPEQVANADIAAAANLLSRLPFVRIDAQAMEATLLLAVPFLQSLFCEIAAIVAFSMGLGHRAFPAPDRSERQEKQGKAFVTYQLPARLPLMSEQQAVLDALDRAGRPVSNEELALLLNCSAGEASKRVSGMGEALKKERDGKRVAISRKT